MKTISWQYVGMIAKEVDLALINKEVQLNILLPEGFHGQHHTSEVRYGQQDISSLTFAHLPDHLEFIPWSFLFDLPHHLQGLIHLRIHLAFLFFFPEKFLSLGRFVARSRAYSSPQVFEKIVVLPR